MIRCIKFNYFVKRDLRKIEKVHLLRYFPHYYPIIQKDFQKFLKEFKTLF